MVHKDRSESVDGIVSRKNAKGLTAQWRFLAPEMIEINERHAPSFASRLLLPLNRWKGFSSVPFGS